MSPHDLQLEQWRGGVAAVLAPYSQDPHGNTYLRSIEIAGVSWIETSGGRRITSSQAKDFYGVVRWHRSHKKSYRHPAHRFGARTPFNTIRITGQDVSRITQRGDVRIGCVHLSWEEMHRIAALYGWGRF